MGVSSSIGSLLGTNNTLMLNWETSPHLEFFGHHAENASVGTRHVHHRNFGILSSIPSEVRLVGHVDEGNPKVINGSLLAFYTNLPGFINPALINITGVLVGVITYDDLLVITGG